MARTREGYTSIDECRLLWTGGYSFMQKPGSKFVYVNYLIPDRPGHTLTLGVSFDPACERGHMRGYLPPYTQLISIEEWRKHCQAAQSALAAFGGTKAFLQLPFVEHYIRKKDGKEVPAEEAFG